MNHTDSPAKTGVLTFHRCINYGSFWQAKCLIEGLRRRGLDAVILDHDSRRVNFAEWKCAFRPTLPTHVPKSDYPFYREKTEKFFRAFERLPLSARFDLNQPETLEDFETVVVGSDEVWNLNHPWFGGCPLFWGENVRSRRLISYAASFGNYPAAEGLDEFWANRLRNFAAISVRDANSQTIVENAIGAKPEMVLDPCLQFPIEPEPREPREFKQPFAAVYGHNFSESFSRAIKTWAKSRNFALVSIGYRNDWADEQWLTADPHDFANFINQAHAVATNFFHGCVFSLVNRKPFVCETTPYRSNKLRGLMTKIGGENHLVTEETDQDVYSAQLNQPLNPAIFEQINRLRQASDQYLDRALLA